MVKPASQLDLSSNHSEEDDDASIKETLARAAELKAQADKINKEIALVELLLKKKKPSLKPPATLVQPIAKHPSPTHETTSAVVSGRIKSKKRVGLLEGSS